MPRDRCVVATVATDLTRGPQVARGTPSSELGAWSPKEAGWWHLCPHHAAGKGVPGCQRAAGRWLMVNPPMLRVPRAMQPGSATGSGDAGCTACDRDAADGALPSPSTRLVACRAACVGLQGGFCIPVLHLHPCVAPWHPCAASPHPCAAFPHLSAAPACTCCISAPVRCISASQALQPCCPCPCFALAAASMAGMLPSSRADASAVPCGGALCPSAAQPEARCSCHAVG